MARLPKNTVDYFPHNCNLGKTIYILESKYGNTGYAFWFKLLEELGRNPNHHFCLSNKADLQFFCAKTKITDREVIEMLDLISSIGGIDEQLWTERMVVWSQNFVNNISDVYRKRSSEIPSKPSLDGINEVKGVDNEIKGVGNPQSKVNKSKVNKTIIKKEERSEISEEISSPPPKVICEVFFSGNEDLRKKIIAWMITNGTKEELAHAELDKFANYWTEPNPTGKKQRWQMEKTFELRRRLSTWLRNAGQWSKDSDQRTEHQKRGDERLARNLKTMGL